MRSENLSCTIYRDQDICGQMTAPTHAVSWQRLGAKDDQAERFEVLLRVLLVVCVGAAMLMGGTWTHATVPATNDAAQCMPVVPGSCVAVEASRLLPRVVVRTAQSLR